MSTVQDAEMSRTVQSHHFAGGSLLVVMFSFAATYGDLSSSMQCLVQQGLSILLHTAKRLRLRFELLPEGCAFLLFLLQSRIQGVLQACIESA